MHTRPGHQKQRKPARTVAMTAQLPRTACPARTFRRPATLALLLAAVSLPSLSTHAQTPASATSETWHFDNLASLGGHPAEVLGHPAIIDTPYGRAVQFNGHDDALFVDVHPLAGARTWTWEVIFHPDPDGAPAQRFFHLSVLDPATGKDLDDRMLFELRIVKGQWCLDTFAMAHGISKVLLNCENLHPLGPWYRVTAVYDGVTLKNYVGDELQGQGDVQLPPQGPGHTSVGVRINLKDYFKGAILEARFTPRSLSVPEFLALPSTSPRH